MDDLKKRVEKKITDYIGFDIKKIINSDIHLAFVFGGAVRDAIAGKKINDVDIMCLTETMDLIIPIINDEGYKLQSSLATKDIQSLYTHVHVIVEPMTFIKIVDDDIRIIQLIRPGQTAMRSKDYRVKNEAEAVRNIYYLLGQVDMSNCAVHYSYAHGLRESFPGAINHCKYHIYEILDTEMYSKRFHMREDKLKQRGWTDKRYADEKQIQRRKKMEVLVVDVAENYYLPPPGDMTKRKYKERTKQDDDFFDLF